MARVPRYLHLPLQVLWFDTEDIAVILVCYVMWMVVSSWLIVPFVVLAPFLFMKIKATRPRGFLRHKLYRAGFSQLRGYPPPHARRFRE